MLVSRLLINIDAYISGLLMYVCILKTFSVCMGGFYYVSELFIDCMSSNGVSKASKSNGVMSEYDENERRRGRSPRKRHLHIIYCGLHKIVVTYLPFTVGRGSVRASSLESRKPPMNLNNPSKFKSINTIAGSKNGSVSEKGGSSNGTGNFIYIGKIVDVIMYVYVTYCQ